MTARNSLESESYQYLLFEILPYYKGLFRHFNFKFDKKQCDIACVKYYHNSYVFCQKDLKGW